MKLKLILSSASLISFIVASKLFEFFYSPLSGVSTAQSLNDDLPAFSLAKAVRDGHINSCLLVLLIVSLLAIWTLVKRK